MVHLSVVPDDRRARARQARRRQVLAAATRVIDGQGLDGLTMQAVADQLDCAVGTLYTYFDSKTDLLAELQADAVDTLAGSYATALETWEPVLEEIATSERDRCLVQLVAFGAFCCAASVVMADEFQLQRLLLAPHRPAAFSSERARSRSLLERLLARPTELLAAASACGALASGDSGERAVRWLAALDGVLNLDNLSELDAHLFRAQHHGRALTSDLLVAWGANRGAVEVAGSHLDRLSALGPLAPPPQR